MSDERGNGVEKEELCVVGSGLIEPDGGGEERASLQVEVQMERSVCRREASRSQHLAWVDL